MKTDIELVQRAKTDINDFTELYNRYFPKMNAFVYHRVSNEEDRREIVSNIFYTAMSKLYMFRFFVHRRCSFQAWLYRIAMNEINQFYRSVKKGKIIEDSLGNELATSNGEEMHYADYNQIKKAMKNLNDEEKNLITLRFFEKCTFREIAEIYKKKENTMKVRVHRIVNKIKKEMEV